MRRFAPALRIYPQESFPWRAVMSHPIAIVLATASLVMLSGASSADDGVVPIDQAVVAASGGFPYKITVPGSYRLSGNLVVKAADTTAVDIHRQHRHREQD
jgi:hypothetical protein